MAKPAPGTTPQLQAALYNVGKLKRHILLCAGPDCCSATEGEAAWAYLKRRIAEMGLAGDPFGVFRTKCHCLRICVGGPIMVVYPDGVWYRGTSPEVIERILQEHVQGGRVVEEWVLARGALPGCGE